MNQSERLVHVKTLIKLKQQEDAIEKSVESFLNSIKIQSDKLDDFKEEFMKYSRERQEIKNVLRTKTCEITMDFEKIKSMVNAFHADKKIDANECKIKMTKLSEKIESFKVSDELKILQKAEKELEDFLMEFKINLLKYNNQKNGFTSGISLSQNSGESKPKIVDDYNEIKDFYSLIVKTGHSEYWKDEDHRLFLKLRKKFPHIPTMVNEIQKICPDLTAEKIVNHEAWYKIYLKLREKQRCAVRTWRNRKNMARDERINSVKSINESKNMLVEKTHPRSEHMDKDIKLNLTEVESGTTTVFLDKKALIKQWKIDKENAKIADEQRLHEQIENMQMLKETRTKTRMIKIKSALAVYKQEKIEKLTKSLSDSNINNNSNKILKSKILLNSLRQKDEEFVKKKLQLLHEKYQTPIKYNINKHKPRSREESTLMKSTKIWEEKCRPEKHEKNHTMYIKDVPKLSSWQWRNQDSAIFP